TTYCPTGRVHCMLPLALFHVSSLFCHSSSTATYPLSLHDALPIYESSPCSPPCWGRADDAHAQGGFPLAPSSLRPARGAELRHRSEEHTSELQSRFDLVCRRLLEKKNRLLRFERYRDESG